MTGNRVLRAWFSLHRQRAVKSKFQVSLDMKPVRLANGYRRFGVACCLHIQGLSNRRRNFSDPEDGDSQLLWKVGTSLVTRVGRAVQSV